MALQRTKRLVTLALEKVKDDSLSDIDISSGTEYLPSTENSASSLEELQPLNPVILNSTQYSDYETKLMSDQSLNMMLYSNIEENIENLPDGSYIEINDSLMLEQEINSNVELLQNQTSVPDELLNKQRIRRKHNCLFCNMKVTNFGRHLERVHADELQVQEISSLDKKSKKRRKLIDKLRREGDFVTATVVPVLKSDAKDHIVCKFCRGYYSSKTLRRHVKKCFFNPDPSKRVNSQIEGQSIMVGQFGPNDILKVSGLLNMLKADEISFIAKKDNIICEVARRYLKGHKEKHLRVVAKRHMRRLARLLQRCRQILSNDKLQLKNLFEPSKLKILIKATRDIANYNELTRCYTSPSLALQMGTLIKNAVNAFISKEVQKEEYCKENIDQANMLIGLIETDWAQEISSEAGQNLNINKFNKPSLIPAVEDIKKFEDYLKKEIANSLSSLESNPQNRLEYRNLLECVYCSIMVFNKRRVGELERMPIDLYEKSNTVKSLEFEKLLTETEKILYSSLKRVVIRGKRGRGVPVLIDKKTEVALDTLIKLRTNFNLDNNIYLFGLPETSNPISGYNVMRKHAQIALGDVKKASLLTSTKLRKHLGTIAQIFRMEKNDLEQLAGFLGHTEKTHAEWYRLPNDIYQTAKVSKLLMLSKSTNIEKYKGLSLDEININDCVIEETYENEEEAEDTEIVQNENECDIPSTSNIPSTSYIASTSDKVHNHKKRTLVPWTKNQKRIAQLFFKKHIKTKTPPKKHEVLEMVQQNPKMFENKSWQVIKVFICNIYNKH